MQVLSFFLLILLTVHSSNNKSVGKYDKVTGQQGLYNDEDNVEILTSINFKAAIVQSQRAWFVEFYNSWCGFCQRFAPTWKDFAADVKGWNDLVVVAAIDCSNDLNYELCREYEVMSYPTLRYYPEQFMDDPSSDKSVRYGYVMNRGNTTDDHRQDLLKKIISEQKEQRAKQFPILTPVTGQSVELSSDFNVLIVQEQGALLGPELSLDFHRYPRLSTRYALANNTALIATLPHDTLPAVYVLSKDGKIFHLHPVTRDRQGIRDAIVEFLRGKDIVVEPVEAGLGQLMHKKKEVDVLMDKVKKMKDVVFQMDLESALRYSLKREVGAAKEISGEKLSALRKYLQTLSKYFPFGRDGVKLLQELYSLSESKDTIDGAEIRKKVIEAESGEQKVFSTPQKWLGCQGSTKQYRGYPCGLWTMFHYLTVNAAESHDANPRVALETMHGYIKNFFGCSDCSQHFQEMAARRNIDNVATLDDAIIWLWQAHNEVNQRLSGDATEDPEHPKVQFPSQVSCPQCNNGDWNTAEVLKYLKHMYSSLNVAYHGADTKIIFQELKGVNTTHGGFLSLDVSLYIFIYIAVFVLIFFLMNVFLKRGYRRKLYRYKHDLLGKV